VPLWLTVASGIVLIAGVLAFLIAYDVGGIRNTAEVNNPQPSNQPARQVEPTPKTVPLNRQAANVAIRFIDTAVARKNLAASYKLTAPVLRQGMSLQQWKTGNIPVQYYPIWAKGAGYSPYEIHWSYRNDVMLKIRLVPKKGSGVKEQEFWIGMKRANSKAQWQVWYFMPYWYPPRLNTRD
jgi:hypothetical protein